MKLLDWHTHCKTGRKNSFPTRSPLWERSSIEHNDFQHPRKLRALSSSRSVPVSSIKQSSGSALSPDRHDPERVGLSLSSLVVIELTRIVKRWEDFHQRSHIFHHTRTYLRLKTLKLTPNNCDSLLDDGSYSIIDHPRSTVCVPLFRYAAIPRKEFRFLPKHSPSRAKGFLPPMQSKSRRRLFHHPSAHRGECSPRDVVTFSTSRF